jgi:hypothetical protein
LKHFTYHLLSVFASNYKQHILSPAKARRKVCYSFAELYVVYVYLNLFGWRRGATFMKHCKGGAQAIKVWEPLC